VYRDDHVDSNVTGASSEEIAHRIPGRTQAELLQSKRLRYRTRLFSPIEILKINQQPADPLPRNWAGQSGKCRPSSCNKKKHQ
jgi:hypothetical protein